MKRQIMLCIGVTVDDDETGQLTADEIGHDLSKAAEGVARRHAGAGYDGRIQYVYLGDESVNARPCARCGNWTTDFERPELVECICKGDHKLGSFLCWHCQSFQKRADS